MKALIGLGAVLFSVTFIAQPAAGQTPLLRYNFDEASSGAAAATDSGAAPAASGVFVGGATRTANTPAGASLGALDLTVAGAGTYLDGGDADKLDGLSAFTLTSWINLQGAPAGNLRIMSKQAGGTFSGFNWSTADPASGTRTAANFGLRMFVGGSTAFAFDPATTGLSIDADNKWAFIAVTYDGTSSLNNVNYYVGSPDTAAVLAATTTVNAGPVLANAAKFGAGYTDAAPTSDTAAPGYFDDLRVYGQTLNLDELNSVRLANVPEPATAVLLAVAAVGCLGRRRRPA